jgi:hypothetical protein
MRPREILRFTRECIDVAVNRGHDKVTQADIRQAERSYSDVALVDISMELKDVDPDYADVPYAFIGAPAMFSEDHLKQLLKDAKVSADKMEKAVDLLLWFGFLGIHLTPDEERYSFEFHHDVKKMLSGVTNPLYCIHPSFRRALGIQGAT